MRGFEDKKGILFILDESLPQLYIAKKPVFVPNGTYCVYLVRCKDASYYCGYSNSPSRRFKDHQAGKVKYTRGKGVEAMRIIGRFRTQQEAMAFERFVKRLRHQQKHTLFIRCEEGKVDG